MNIDWNKIYQQVTDWLIERGPGILLAIVVFIAGMLLIKLLNKWLRRSFERRRVNPSVRYFLQNLFSVTMQVLLVILSLQIAGFQLTIFAAIVAGLTVAIGLALSGTLQNFVSGILILFMKPYRTGDTINAQGQEGVVTSIQLFYTVIQTSDNKTIIIPNGQLSNSVVINLSKESKRRLDTTIEFTYNEDFAQIKEVIAKIIAEAKDILPDPALQTGVSKLGPDRFVVTVQLWTTEEQMDEMRLQVNERLMKGIKAAGIKLPGMKQALISN